MNETQKGNRLKMLSLLPSRIRHLMGHDIGIQKIRVSGILGIAVGSSFAAFNLLTDGMEALGALELAALILLALPGFALAKRPQDAERSNTLFVLCAMTFMGGLVIFGGVKDTGLFWVYLFPFLAFFFKGLRKGFKFCLAFLVFVGTYLLCLSPMMPMTHQYSAEVRLHFFIALLFYTIVAAAFSNLQKLSDERLLSAKEMAESAYRAKSRFLAAASHDIRQPAHALGLFVSRLSSVQHDDNTRELVHGVEASVRSLEEMLDVFFDYSKLDSESVGLNLRPVSIERLFQHLQLSFASIAAAKGLTLHIRKSDVWVVSDSVLLQRVLLNLVSNAIKYTERGRVLIACRPTKLGSHARLQVWDTGIGIAQNELEMIFEEFYQINNAERDRAKGLGLGLSMVKRSCDLLSHPLKIRSQIGRGTHFTVLVPIAPDSSRSPESTIEELSMSGGGFKDLHVIVIEDDLLSSQALTGLLRSWGCHVSTFHDADHACSGINRNQVPDVIVSDYRLPGKRNGVDAIRNIRQICECSIPSVLISGDKNEELRLLASTEGLVLLTIETSVIHDITTE